MKFVRRQANVVAYTLAKETTLLANSAIYYDIPDYIESLIINKMLKACFCSSLFPLKKIYFNIY